MKLAGGEGLEPPYGMMTEYTTLTVSPLTIRVTANKIRSFPHVEKWENFRFYNPRTFAEVFNFVTSGLHGRLTPFGWDSNPLQP